MKLLKFFLFTTVIFTMASCSSDDDSGSSTVELTNANLAGTYEITFLEGTEIETDGNTSVVVSTEEFTTDTFTNAVYTFSEDGTFSNSGSYRVVSTTTITGQSPETEFEIVTFDDDEYAYSVNNANRTITIDGDLINVSLFDGTNLRITFSDVEVDDGNTFTFNSEMRLVKLN